MLFSLIPLLIIFISLGGIVYIIIKKFPQLAALEVEKIAEVKQAKVKQELALQRFERSLKNFNAKAKKLLGYLSFFSTVWEKSQDKFRKKVYQVQEKYKKTVIEELEKKDKEEIYLEPVAKEDTVVALLEQAEQAFLKGDYSFAERKYIDVIKKDPRNVEAYRGLGKIYFDQDKYKEAYETFKFLIKLNPQDSRAYNRLGMIAERMLNYEEAAEFFEEAIKLDKTLAIRYYDLGRIYAKLNKPAAALKSFLKSVKIEPNNPRYLDQLLEMSIITRDKDMALQILAKLEEVNPQNQKLTEFKERILEIKI